MDIFKQVGEIFNGPSAPPAMNSGTLTKNSMPSNSANAKVPNTRSVSTPTSTLNKFRTRETPASNDPSLQAGGKRKMRSKSKSLRSLLFLKYKYKMARRSTMRKGRKASRKASRKGSRRARR